MRFSNQQLYHIYNQGNNRQQIFFSPENYTYFLWKMRAYLLPFGDLIGYCLMPNHFHWLFWVKKAEITRRILREQVDNIEWQRRLKVYGKNARTVNYADDRVADIESLVGLNDAIGILQKSYTRAINKEKNWTGSLFRKEFKAKDGWIDEFITLKKANNKLDYRFQQGTDYAYQCLSYVHQNPKMAGLVVKASDWPFSSAKDYARLRRGTLCNLELGREIMNFI